MNELKPQIYLLRECFRHHLILNGDDTRKIINNLNSKHSIDVLGLLMYYDIGDTIDLNTKISAILHDNPEEGKETVEDITRFMYDLVRSVPDLDYTTRKLYLEIPEIVSANVALLTDPYYLNLQKIKTEVDLYENAVSSSENHHEINKLKEIVSEEKGQSLISKLDLISKEIKKNKNLENNNYLKRIHVIIQNLEKDYLKYLYNVYSYNWSAMVIKIIDALAQNDELDEIPYLNKEEKKRFKRKHKIIKKYGQEKIDKWKEGKESNDILIEDISLTLGEYNSLEDFKIRGPDFLLAITKRFFNLDYCCYRINKIADYDNKVATLINSKNALIPSTLDVNRRRQEHIVDCWHVPKKDAREIKKDVANYGDIDRITFDNSPNSILTRCCIPAMRGEYENLRDTDKDKKLQLRILYLLERVFLLYTKDIVQNDFGEFKNKNLFTFGWGDYLKRD